MMSPGDQLRVAVVAAIIYEARLVADDEQRLAAVASAAKRYGFVPASVIDAANDAAVNDLRDDYWLHTRHRRDE